MKKFEKSAFDGDEAEKAYLLGLARGDLGVARHGRAIRVKTSSTHPAMIELVLSLFAPYGPTRVYPHFSKLVGYEWTVEGEVDQSFEFLLRQKVTAPTNDAKIITFSYLGGLFDSEGSVWLSDERAFAPRLSFTNKDMSMLDWIENQLTKLGFHSWRSLPDKRHVCRTHLWRSAEVLALVQALPLRHPEKKAKARLLLGRKDRVLEFDAKWYRLLDDIDYDRIAFIELARQILETKVAPGVKM